MSGTTSVVFSPVKEAIEVQSGRFEFFKQALTLSLAGIAGLAALFADVDKIPSDYWTRLVISLTGIILLATAAASIFGISSYANLLRQIEKETADPDKSKDRYNSTYYKEDIVRHALASFWGLMLTGMALLVFAGLRMLPHPVFGPEAALSLGHRIIVGQLGSGHSIDLDHFESHPDFLRLAMWSNLQASNMSSTSVGNLAR